ncbi:type II toxin-antitoxin system HicB family antitoxin [Chloroflexota bacterium]
MVRNKGRKVTLELSIFVRKEGNQYSSWCPELDVASCGDTMEEACNNLDDAVDLYLDTLLEEEDLLRILDERGFKPSKDSEEREICEAPFLSSRHKALTVPV